MRRVRVLDGVTVSVEWRNGEQVIVAEWPVGETSGMTHLLSTVGGEMCKVQQSNGLMRMELQHTQEVDRHIMDLTDLLIDIRVLHPTMVQLKLVLNEADGEELLRVLVE